MDLQAELKRGREEQLRLSSKISSLKGGSDTGAVAARGHGVQGGIRGGSKATAQRTAVAAQPPPSVSASPAIGVTSGRAIESTFGMSQQKRLLPQENRIFFCTNGCDRNLCVTCLTQRVALRVQLAEYDTVVTEKDAEIEWLKEQITRLRFMDAEPLPPGTERDSTPRVPNPNFESRLAQEWRSAGYDTANPSTTGASARPRSDTWGSPASQLMLATRCRSCDEAWRASEALRQNCCSLADRVLVLEKETDTCTRQRERLLEDASRTRERLAATDKERRSLAGYVEHIEENLVRCVGRANASVAIGVVGAEFGGEPQTSRFVALRSCEGGGAICELFEEPDSAFELGVLEMVSTQAKTKVDATALSLIASDGAGKSLKLLCTDSVDFRKWAGAFLVAGRLSLEEWHKMPNLD